MIRRAVPGDAGAVAGLINAINSLDGPCPSPPMKAEIVLRDLICAAPKALLPVAESDGQLAGFATAGLIYDAERRGWAIMLLDLYVTPACRRRGLAREAQRQGALCLWWGVDQGDDAATLFYRAIGARSEGLFSGELLKGAALARLAEEARA